MNRLMILWTLLLAIAPRISGQILPNADHSRRMDIRIVPLYQHWSLADGEIGLTEASSALEMSAPLSEDLDLSLWTARGAVSGDIAGISGFTDTQIGLTYSVVPRSVVASLGINLPSGGKEFSTDELATARLLSNTMFDFQIRTFGQGWNVNPGITWAFLLSPRFIAGVGASYQYKGPFRALAFVSDYKPGNEGLVTAGLDYQLSPWSVLSADLLYTAYGKDMIGSREVFAAGSMATVSLQLVTDFGRNQLALLGRYRTKAKSEVAIGSRLIDDGIKLIPNEFDAGARYRRVFSSAVAMNLQLDIRTSEETDNPYSGMTLYGGGFLPEFSLSSAVALTGRLLYHTGTMKGSQSIKGTDIGAGVAFIF